MAISKSAFLLSCSLPFIVLSGCGQTKMFYSDPDAIEHEAPHNIQMQQSKAQQKVEKPQLTAEQEARMLVRAKQYFNQENYELSYTELLPLAKAGNADAQYGLGYLLYYGMGIHADKKSGIEWISKSAEQDFPNAIRALKLLKQHAHNAEQTEPHEHSKLEHEHEPQAKTERYNPDLNKHIFALNDTSLLDDSTNHPADQTVDALDDVTNLASKVYSARTKDEILKRLGAVIAKENASVKTYGPTKNKDTLWHIAQEVKPADFSIAQMMMALLKYNPNAFTAPNINALKRGVILQIPPKEFIAELNPEKMLGELIAQNDTWPNKRHSEKP